MKKCVRKSIICITRPANLRPWRSLYFQICRGLLNVRKHRCVVSVLVFEVISNLHTL